MEESAEVRDAMNVRGIPAVSCDLIDSARPGPHHKGNVFDIINLYPWKGGIFFPTCTYLCSSGLHWNKRVAGRQARTDAAVEDVKCIWNSDIPKLAIENPIGCLSTRFMPPTQIIQPWMFGHPESKATCLWLRGLPPLKPTRILSLSRPAAIGITKRPAVRTSSVLPLTEPRCAPALILVSLPLWLNNGASRRSWRA